MTTPTPMAPPPLLHKLRTRIAAQGPIRLSDYMATCLLDPDHGYYTTRPVLGQAGDFTTAPEISQMFGEMIGLALAQSWLDQGSPARFILAEAGPGRGTLMADVLRATRAVPGFHDAAQIYLIEASPALTQQQRDTLTGYQATWITELGNLPQGPLWFLANEFFDALPIRQFRRTGAGWAELRVGLGDTSRDGMSRLASGTAASGTAGSGTAASGTSASGTAGSGTAGSGTSASGTVTVTGASEATVKSTGKGVQKAGPIDAGPNTHDRLSPGFAPPTAFAELNHRLKDTKDGDIVETCAPAIDITVQVAQRLRDANKGAALIIDYGDWRSLGDTLQALRDHRIADPFAAPGLADLTAHVDFEPLAMTAREHGITHSLLAPQGVFLERLGITARAQTLAGHLQGDALTSHIAAHRRLTHPDEMGRLFKVMALTPLAAPPLPGTEPSPAFKTEMIKAPQT